MLIEVNVWKDGNSIVVRNDLFHINTFGATLEEALKNFHEAFLLNMEENKQAPMEIPAENLTLVMQYPIQKQ
jgi:predicted RNase H-like HicB family nuclease